MQRGPQLQVVQMTPVVKKLIIINLAVWLVGQMIVEQYFLDGRPLITYFSLVPGSVIQKFFIWQPFTYMFLHSMSITHIVFNMLMLWWFGAELEQRWGSRFFTIYYLACGIGAALIYTVGISIYSVLTGSVLGLISPVVGASGAIFGLLLAFGILFGERTILFFFVFPMRVKYFVMIIGAIEVVSLLNVGQNNNVANLAHLGGLVSGYIFLISWTKYQQKKRTKKSKKGRGNLRLVVDNEEENDRPKYWN